MAQKQEGSGFKPACVFPVPAGADMSLINLINKIRKVFCPSPFLSAWMTGTLQPFWTVTFCTATLKYQSVTRGSKLTEVQISTPRYRYISAPLTSFGTFCPTTHPFECSDFASKMAPRSQIRVNAATTKILGIWKENPDFNQLNCTFWVVCPQRYWWRQWTGNWKRGEIIKIKISEAFRSSRSRLFGD